MGHNINLTKRTSYAKRSTVKVVVTSRPKKPYRMKTTVGDKAISASY